MTRTLLPFGDRAVLIEFTDPDEAPELARALGRLHIPDIVDLVPGATTLLVRLASPPTSDLLATVRTTPASALDTSESTLLEIGVHYDGDDLAEVAALCGLTPADVIARHSGSEWRVQFLGFAPGFAYLSNPDAGFDVPRRSSPRPRVPAGSVALAGTWSGVYPRQAPGGWHLIGRTEIVLFDPTRTPAVPWRAGDRVRFVDLSPPPPCPRGRATSPQPPPSPRGRATSPQPPPSQRGDAR